MTTKSDLDRVSAHTGDGSAVVVEGSESWSPVPLAICEICSLIWVAIVFGFAAYAVFWLNRSGWWFLLSFLVCQWTCKAYMSPAQLRALSEAGDKRKKSK